jgi:hypothetical protein
VGSGLVTGGTVIGSGLETAGTTVASGTVDVAGTVASGTVDTANTVATGVTSVVEDIISAFDLSVIGDLLNDLKITFNGISSSISNLGTDFNQTASGLSGKFDSI